MKSIFVFSLIAIINLIKSKEENCYILSIEGGG